MALAHREYQEGELATALDLLETVAARALEAADTAVRAEALTWLSYAARWEGEFERSRTAATEAVALRVAAGGDDELWRSHNALGLLSWWQSRLTEAMSHFDAALSAARSTANARAVAQVENNRGLVFFDRGEIAAARERFESLIRVARELGDPLEEARGLTNLGMVNIEVGDAALALERLREARRLYEHTGRARELQVVLGHLGAAHMARGDFDRAYAVVDTALLLSSQASLPSDEAQNLELLAAIHAESGDPRRALEMLRRAVDVHLGLDDDLLAGRDLRTQAELLANLGSLQAARETALQALELHRGTGSTWEELRDRIVVAEIMTESGEVREAERELAAAERLAAALDLAAPRTEVGLARARTADARGDPAATLSAIAHVRAIGPPSRYSDEWEAAALAARAHARLGNHDQAIRLGRRAVGLVERVRGQLGSAKLRGGVVSARRRTYADLVGSLVLTGRLAEAFAVADAARGRALTEHLATSPPLISRDSAFREVASLELLLRGIGRLRAALDTLEARSPQDVDPEGLEDIRRLLTSARRDYESRHLALETGGSPRVRALGIGEVDIAELQSSLRPGEALIEYLVASREVFVFVLTPTALAVATSNVDEETLASRVRLARDRIAHGDPDPEDLRSLEQLYRDLIEPALRSAPIVDAHRLLFVPQGPLAYLPFAALRNPDSGEYLGERYELVHLPTASALPLLRGRPVTTDPGRLTVFAPFPDELPGTSMEAERVGGTVPGSDVLTGSAATEARLRAALESGAAVHLASHASLAAESPMFSSVELARGHSDPRDDGTYELHEVLAHSIASPLVFLSGCETGLGRAWSDRFSQGEDYATLAQAFLFSGARQVVATLWRIEDEGAAEFAAVFYDSRRRGASVPEAATIARRTLLRSERFAAPLYWAGYRVSG